MDTITSNIIAESNLDESVLNGKRILVCGKGGSGKSTIVTLLANILSNKNGEVVVIDGDSSNPGGLGRLLFGLKESINPLIEFFGGREKVECPIDDPSILTRLNDDIPITKRRINLAEVPGEYYVQKNGITFFQVGKTDQPFEGCDGPMSKVTRDFVIGGNVITLIDVEAGIEHYGRGIEKNVDMVIVVVDPTFESFLIAQKVSILCHGMEIKYCGVVINKISTNVMKLYVEQELFERGLNVYGLVRYDKELFEAGLVGTSIKSGIAMEEVKKIVGNMIKDVK